MRISGGAAKGKRIRTLKNRRLRPTSDKIRQAIFNIIGRERIKNSVVLDLFAGSGALGIEALSRGARMVNFVERERTRCGLIKKNLSEISFAGSAEVIQGDFMRVIRELGQGKNEFSVILADPPYNKGFVSKTLEVLGSGSLLKLDGILIIEHSKSEAPGEKYGCLLKQRTRVYGDTAISIFERRNGNV